MHCPEAIVRLRRSARTTEGDLLGHGWTPGTISLLSGIRSPGIRDSDGVYGFDALRRFVDSEAFMRELARHCANRFRAYRIERPSRRVGSPGPQSLRRTRCRTPTGRSSPAERSRSYGRDRMPRLPK